MGRLDGKLLMRYAHIYRERTSGGMEQYLKQLNEDLLLRNSMTIVQMHLSEAPARAEVQEVGLGRILWVPVRIIRVDPPVRSLTSRLKQLTGAVAEDVRCRGSFFRVCRFIRMISSNRGAHLRHPVIILNERLVQVFRECRVDLVAFHWLSYDVSTVFDAAVRRRIPCVFVNHFDNGRLGKATVRRWLTKVRCVGGVSTREVPPHVAGKYVNLSDAVDTEFFSRVHAREVRRGLGRLILLPARITEGKGHLDAVEALSSVRRDNPNVRLAFAGVEEPGEFPVRLRAAIASRGLTGDVMFLGQLSSTELRDWYAASDLVVLPSVSEGLGRVLLEAQSMSIPVIAYNSSGIPDALIHGQTGFLVERGNSFALARSFELLLNDDELHRRMGAAARQFVQHAFSRTALVERHEKFYLRCFEPGGAVS